MFALCRGSQTLNQIAIRDVTKISNRKSFVNHRRKILVKLKERVNQTGSFRQTNQEKSSDSNCFLLLPIIDLHPWQWKLHQNNAMYNKWSDLCPHPPLPYTPALLFSQTIPCHHWALEVPVGQNVNRP